MLLERSEEVAGLTLYKLLTKSWPIKTCFQQLFLKKVVIGRQRLRQSLRAAAWNATLHHGLTPADQTPRLACYTSMLHGSNCFWKHMRVAVELEGRKLQGQRLMSSSFVLPLVKLIELELEWIFSSLAKDKRTKCLVSDLLCGPRIENTQEQ